MILDATAPHTRVDNFVIDDYGDKIGAYGLAVYMVIKRHYNWLTGQCTPSYNRIAQMCKISRSTVKRTVKSLKAVGLIDPQLRFTDDGQTSNQYGFYQPERPKPRPAPEQKGSPAHMDTPAQASSPPGSHRPPREASQTPDQVSGNKKEKQENAKDIPEKTEKEKNPASKEKTEKQKNCPHPYAEVVRLSGGITICNACFDCIEFPLVA